ncbi:MAG TPA: permease prefix domain 1-containing protein [Silvibacterium sp.]|nr:permease prefix domain 1-containing protein [Silvibacterium sp.]
MNASLRAAVNRMRSFFKESQDRQLDDELASPMDLVVEENIASGISPKEARRKSLVRFGGVHQAREQQREARGLPSLDVLMQDLRYTCRTLRRDREFASIARGRRRRLGYEWL